MMYFVIWFVGFCLLIGYGVAFEHLKDDDNGTDIGYIMLSLIWPIALPFAVCILASYGLMRLIRRCLVSRRK